MAFLKAKKKPNQKKKNPTKHKQTKREKKLNGAFFLKPVWYWYNL